MTWTFGSIMETTLRIRIGVLGLMFLVWANTVLLELALGSNPPAFQVVLLMIFGFLLGWDTTELYKMMKRKNKAIKVDS